MIHIACERKRKNMRAKQKKKNSKRINFNLVEEPDTIPTCLKLCAFIKVIYETVAMYMCCNVETVKLLN